MNIRHCLLCTFLVCVAAVSTQCKSAGNREQPDTNLQTAFEDFKRAVCNNDMDALRRIEPPADNDTPQSYERNLGLFKEELSDMHGSDTAEYYKWLATAHIERIEYSSDRTQAKLWLGPETDKTIFGGSEVPARKLGEPNGPAIEHRIPYNQIPVEFQLHKDHWVFVISG